jgi:hypothetical protein
MHNCIIGGVGKARSGDGNNVATGYASLPEVGMRDTMPGKPKLFTTMVAESVAIYPPVSTTVRTIACVPSDRVNEVIQISPVLIIREPFLHVHEDRSNPTP